MAKTRKRSASTPGRGKTVPVTFTCHAPWAISAFLVGTFNDWSVIDTPMQRDERGEWSVTLELEPGTYEYKYFIDGRWCCEPGCCDSPMDQCADCVPNAFGTMNRVVQVIAKRGSKPIVKGAACVLGNAAATAG